jgi:glycosyltransferase involved in cell wall biosynthesis
MGAFATVFRWMVLGSATGVLCFICGCLKPELGGWCLRMAVKVLRSKPVVFLCCASAVTLLYSMWHASLDHFVFDSAGMDADGAIEAALLRGRPVLVLRNRILEPSGFAAETLDFIAALEDHYYIAVQNDGNYDPRVRRARPLETRRRLDELLADHRLDYATAHPHTLLHVGAASDFSCDEPETTYCIGRTAFETDRVPRDWVSKLNTQHRVWVPSPFNIETFARAGVKADKLRFVPEPLDTELYSRAAAGSDAPAAAAAAAAAEGSGGQREVGDDGDDDISGRRRLRSRSGLVGSLDELKDCDFVFLSVFAWGDQKGWDVLLRGFFSEFERRERVCLLLRTYPKNDGVSAGPKGGDQSREIKNLIVDYVARTYGKPLQQLARVHVVGYQVDVESMPALYAAADAFVLPTRGEGWGRPIAEAMAMGLPVRVQESQASLVGMMHETAGFAQTG